LASVSAMFDNGTNDQAFHPFVREERREAGPYASIPFGSPRKAEAFRGSPWIGVSKPKLRGASPGSPPGAEAPWRFTLDPCFGRSLGSSPLDRC
jgi:hypothetical protein